MEAWSSAARYEPYVGRWSRVVAPRFIASLGMPAGLAWLDVGCGTGALTGAILDVAEPSRVLGIDRAADYVAFARANVTDGRASFEEGDASALPVADGEFDVAVSGLMLNFVPDPAAALAEMRRAVTGRGMVAAYVWDYADGMEFMRRFWDAAIALDPAAKAFDQGQRFPLCAPGPLAALFEDAGLEDVAVEAIDIETPFATSMTSGRRFSGDRDRRRRTWPASMPGASRPCVNASGKRSRTKRTVLSR